MVRATRLIDQTLPYTHQDLDHSPLIIYYEVNKSYDLLSTQCASSPDLNELNPEEAKLLVDQVTEFPIPPMLYLTGGDPLRRPDIYDLVEYASDYGLEVSISILPSNLVDGAVLQRLGRAGIQTVALRLEGADAATHDAMCSAPGSFDQTLRVLAEARTEEVPTQITTTVTAANYHQIDAMAELLARQGIVSWSVFFLAQTSYGANLAGLARDQYDDVFTSLWQQAQRQPYTVRTKHAPGFRRFAIQNQHSPCNGSHPPGTKMPVVFMPSVLANGTGEMFVGHTGLIHPNSLLRIICGLFPLQHIAHVYRNSPILCGLRDANRLEGKCSVCEYRHLCGGSRARAYAVTGNPYAQDPHCTYVPPILQ